MTAAQVIDMTPGLLSNLLGQFGILGFKERETQVVAVGGPLGWAPTEHGLPAFVLNRAGPPGSNGFQGDCKCSFYQLRRQ
jgi:hypothetical protein